MQYQSFPGVKGGSLSFDKLKSLRLPNVKNKRFLDVGCNEGFFCGFAYSQGAQRVVGVDYSSDAIRKAKIRFPKVEFINQSWDSLPEGPFDVITLLSALHYAKDQALLIDRLVNLLSDDGVLVLEIGIAPGTKNEWIDVERSIDTRVYPTRSKISAVLDQYAWKMIGYSVIQAGDPLQRYVIHVRKFKPYVYLFLENPGSGKSTICKKLFANNVLPVISGDGFYQRLAAGRVEGVSKQLYELVRDNFQTTQIDKVISLIFEKKLSSEMVELWMAEAKNKDFALDTYVPVHERQSIYSLFEGRGYFPVNLSWDTKNKMASVGEASRRISSYRKFLTKESAAYSAHKVFTVKSIVASEHKVRLKWHLDSPSTGGFYFEDLSINVSGWIVPLWDIQQPYLFYVRYGDNETRKETNVRREDALRYVLGDDFSLNQFWKNNHCGFSLVIPSGVVTQGFEVGVLCEDKIIPLAKVSIARKKRRFFTTLLGKRND